MVDEDETSFNMQDALRLKEMLNAGQGIAQGEGKPVARAPVGLRMIFGSVKSSPADWLDQGGAGGSEMRSADQADMGSWKPFECGEGSAVSFVLGF